MTVYEWELKCSDLHQVIADNITGICDLVLTRHKDFVWNNVYTEIILPRFFLCLSSSFEPFPVAKTIIRCRSENMRCIANSIGFVLTKTRSV